MVKKTKKQYKVKPNLRTKIAFQKVVENKGNISKGMREAGYSPKSAHNPKQLTKSKGWQQLMDKYLPDAFLAKKHKELLNKKEKGEVDTQAVSKGLDMAYKLKGRYENDGPDVNIDNHFSFAIDKQDGHDQLGKDDKTGGSVELFGG